MDRWVDRSSWWKACRNLSCRLWVLKGLEGEFDGCWKLQEVKVDSNSKRDKAKWFFQVFRWWWIVLLLLIIVSYSARHTATCLARHTRLLCVREAAVWPLPALLSHLPSPTFSYLAPWVVFSQCAMLTLIFLFPRMPRFLCSEVLFPSLPPPFCPCFPHCLHFLTITFMTWCSYFVLLPPARASSWPPYRLLGSLIALLWNCHFTRLSTISFYGPYFIPFDS